MEKPDTVAVASPSSSSSSFSSLNSITSSSSSSSSSLHPLSSSLPSSSASSSSSSLPTLPSSSSSSNLAINSSPASSLPSSPSNSALHYRVKYENLLEINESMKAQLADEKLKVALAEEKNRGLNQELTNLLANVKIKLFKTDEERKEHTGYAQERMAMREELDAMRARMRENSDSTEVMRTEAVSARAQLAEYNRRAEEKERSMNRLRAALTNFEHRSSKTNLLDFDNELSQVRTQLAAKRKKYKDAKVTILKNATNMIDINQQSLGKDKKIESLEEQLGAARAEIEELHRKIRNEIATVVSLTHDNVSVTTELEKFRKINKEIKRDSDDLHREILVLKAENALLQGPLTHLESELAKELDALKALQSEELSLGDSVVDPSPSPSLHTSERAIHLQLEIDKLNSELEQAQKLTKQSESLQSKLKEAKKKNKTMKEDFTERRKNIELTKEKSESHIVMVKDEPPRVQQTRTNSNPSLPPEGVKQEGIEQLKESHKVITDTLQKVKIRSEKSNLEQHIEQLLGNLPPIKEEKTPEIKAESKSNLKQESKSEVKLDPIPEEKEGASKKEEITQVNGGEKESGLIVSQVEMKLELPLKTPVVRMGTLERTLSATKLRLERSSSRSSLLDTTEVPEDWKEREKALNAQFERLKKVVLDAEKQKAEASGNGSQGAKTPMELSESLVLLKPSKVKSVEKLQKRIQDRQDKIKQMGVTEMGLFAALVEEAETKLTESEEELVLQIPYAQEDDDSLIDILVRTLADKYKRAREANRERILTEVTQLVKDINSNLSHKITRQDVDTDLEENIHVVNECKKLNYKLVTELENLQIIAQQESQGKQVKPGWWRGWGTGEENVSDVDAAAKFLIRESQRLYDLRDNYVAVCNKVAHLSESVHQCERDLFKWRLGLEDIHDRITARMEGGTWGPALSEKLCVCRRLLINHLSVRGSLDAARTQRSTMRLLVENFSEGLYVVFSAEEGLGTLGSKVVAELTKIRQAERKVMKHREEMLEDNPLQEMPTSKKKVARIAHGGLAGVSLLSTMILHSPQLFSRFHVNDVPDIVRKSVTYLEERAMDDQGLLLRTYDLPKITQIKKFFESGSYDVDLSDCADHRVISELLKSHLRDMRTPLFTFDLYRDWMKIDQIESGDDQLTCIRGLIEKLPSENFSCLAVIMHFLHKVACNVAVNKCSTRLLARVFSPLMLRKR